MGKKSNHVSRRRTEKKEDKGRRNLEPMTRTHIVNLHRRLYKTTFKKKAPTAVKQIKKLAHQTMFTKDVRIDPELNKELWRHGVRNIARRVRVSFERKKNEDEEAVEPMYTVVRLAK